MHMSWLRDIGGVTVHIPLHGIEFSRAVAFAGLALG
jgi:hypothetical protein